MAAKYPAKCLLLALMLAGITAAEAVNTPPTIGAIHDQTVFEDHPTDAYLLAVNDAETPVLSLQLSGVSSNPGVVPPENIFFGVANGLWYLTVTPAFGVASGNSSITVTVSDGITNASTSFLFTVNPPPPGATRFVNNSPISIPDGNGAPYPSQITVNGKAGLITNMNLTLSKFSHERVQDVNMLLVGPTGKGVVIFSHISGGSRSASNVTVYLTDTSLYPLPQDFALWSEPLKPTAYTPPSSFPGSAPAGPYAPVAFSTFNGLNANGTWSLYVYDDTAGATGAITAGWSMTIFTDGSTGPQISPIADQFIAENSNTGPIPFTLSDPDTPLNSLILSTNSSNTTLVPLSNIVLGGSGASRTVTVTPAAGQTGTSTITVAVSDGTNNASASFVLTVSAPATQVRVETAANGSGTVVQARNINPGGSITVYAIARDAGGNFVTNVPADSWSLANVSGGVVNGDLIAAADRKSATFTGHSAGSATIHVASAGLTSTDSGVLTVLSSAAPVITPISDKMTLMGRSAGPFPITITDADTAAGSLILSGTSSDQTLVPNTNIFIYNSGAQSLTVTPAPGQTGTATITLTASDGVNITSNSFLLTVNPSGPGLMIFDNASLLTIPNTGAVSPYPSTINVSGMAGNITNLTLTLKDLTTPAPHDLEMLLVAPTGQKVVVFSRVGGGIASHVSVTLDDAAAYPLPPSPYAILTGTYQPTDLGHVDPFPSPAPAGPYATALSAFKGVSPDGDWNLYVIDDIGGNGAGTIAGGWSLAIATDNPITSPLTISAIPNQTITMDTGTGPIPFTLNDPGTDLNTLMLSTNSSNTTLVPLSNIVLGGSGANRTVTVTPAAGQTGTSTITVAVSDGTNNASTTFLLTVSAPPTQVRVETAANGSGTVVPTRNINLGSSVTVYAIARDAAGNFVTNVPTDSWSLLNVSGGVVSGDLVAAADMKSATFTGHSAGSATIHVASAGLTSTDSGTLTVLSSAPPVITSIPDKTTLVGRSAGPFPITITDADTPPGSLVLSGTSSDQTLVPNTNIFIYNSGAQSLTVTPAPGRTGTATITLMASDGVNVTSNSFLLTVNPSGPGLMIFDNASLLTLPDTGAVTPYPSTINVSGMDGGITNLTLTLKDLTTPVPHDLEMLLVGPTGQKVVVFSRVGGGTASHISVTLDDTAFYELPPSPYQIITGTYKPKDFGNVDPFPSPAPAGPYGTTMSAFNGLSPNGAWNLYVIDDVAGNGAGTIAEGWSLAIATDTSDTSPTISSIPAQTLMVNSASAAIPFTVNDAETPATNLTLSASSSNPTLAPTNQIVFGGFGPNRTLTVTPASNHLGTATITIIVSDGVLTASNSFLLTVNPAQMTVTIDNATRVYGTTNPTFTGTLAGLQAGDNITATFTTTAVTNSRVGTYAIVPLFSDPGSKLGNYQVTTNGGTLTITKASLIVTATGTNKVYNGTATAGVTLSDNRLAGDSLTASYTNASFADKNVGTGKPVSVSGISISGTSATNYTCNTTASTTANIAPRALVVSAAGVSRAYNGTIAATVALSDNRVAGDSLAVTYASASFPDKNAALGKAVSVSGIAVSGTDSTNYTFNATAATTADIIPVGLTIVGAAAQDKPYDGTTAATPDISSAGLVGVMSGDAVTLNSAGAVGTFDTKSVGTGKTVRISGLALSGADAMNYTLTQMTSPGLVAAYAFSEGVGTTVADASGNGNIGTLANVTWTDVGKFGSALVFNGTSAKVTINDSVLLHLTTGMTLEAWVNPSTVSSAWRDVIYKGNDNYYLEATSASSGNGRPAMGGTFTGASGALYATATLTTNSWTHLAATYDGGTMRLYVNGVQVASRAQTGNIATSTNYLQIAGDTINQQFFRGAIDEVRVYNVARTAAQVQADMSTPIFPYSALTTTADITAAPLGVTGISADDKVYDATTTATLHTSGASLVGVITGDSLTLNTAGATGAFTDANVGNNKTVNVSGLALSGADVPNYRLTQPSTTANITAAATTNVVSSSANPSAPGTPVTLTAKLTAGVNPATPTGTVQFLTNGVAVGNPLLLSNGVAAVNMAFLATGTNTVIAAYAGDGNFLGSTNSLVQIVMAQGSVTLGIKANGDQTVTVSFSGTPGSNYVVQVTSDLSSPTAWSNVATNTAGGDGRWTFTDSATRPHYYYRSATAP